MNDVDLVNEIVTAYGVQVFNVERVIAEYGSEMTEAALVAVRDLPIPPESPFGWMISQLRNGNIQAKHVAAAKAGAGATERARRYCEGQHTPGMTSALKRLAPLSAESEALLRQKGIDPNGRSVCFVCGQEVVL